MPTSNYTYHKWSERLIGAFKYVIGGYMMLAGALTPFQTDPSTKLGWIYSSHYSLTVLGIIVFVSGAALIYGKVRKSKKWTGKGLLWIYLCFLFATIMNFVAYAGDPTYWVGNLVAGLITAALWLRWKNKTEYINPNHFTRDIAKITAQDRP
jgi:hypothetical protein